MIPYRWMWTVAGTAIVIGCITGGIRWYGSNQYDAGKHQCQLEAQAAAAKVSEEYRKKEAADRKKAEEEYAKYQSEQAKTAAARDRLANLYSSLQHDTAILKRRLSEAGTDPKRIIAIGEAGIGSYESCRKEYIDMGKELAGLSDKHNGLIAQCK